MKRAAVILGILSLGIASSAVLAGAQTAGQSTQQNPPAAAQGTAGAAATPQVTKRPPQTKTQAEFDAYKAAMTGADPAALEKAAEDFATKFPDSEVRILLYKNAMRMYQNSNNAEKTEAMGRKVIGLDGDDPEALTTVAEVITERTHDTDLDKDQRLADAVTMAQKGIQTVDTDVQVPANVTPEQITAYKALLRSNAYMVLGTIDFKKENYPSAQENLQKSIDAYPSNPDPVVVLRLALALDKQQKYPEALKVANRAVELTQENSAIGTPARRERDRLQQLTGGAAPTPPKN